MAFSQVCVLYMEGCVIYVKEKICCTYILFVTVMQK